MKQEISLSAFTLARGQILEQTEEGTVYLCPPEGLQLTASGVPGAPVAGVSWAGMRYLTIEAECLEEHSAAFDFCLWEQGTEGKFDMRIMFGILPGLMTPVPIELKNLESQEIFPERTLGRLKMGVFGKPVDWRAVDRVALVSVPLDHPHKIRIRGVYVSDTLPEIAYPKRALMDELGQWMGKDWQGKTQDRSACTERLWELLSQAEAFDGTFPAEKFPHFDRWGGDVRLQFEKTGWFYVTKKNDRWWLVDPEGNGFFSTGIDCINPGTDTRTDVMADFFAELPPESGIFAGAWDEKRGGKFVNFGIANLMHAFGEGWREAWGKIVRKYLISYGFNTVGNWSDIDFIKASGMAYVLPLDRHSVVDFPSTEVKVFRDFPDVFAPEFADNAEKFAAGLLPFRDDPALIGYFMRNEPAWAFVYELCIAEELLANPAALVSKEELIQTLKKQYGQIDCMNNTWMSSFSDFDDLKKPIHRACSLSPAAKADLESFSEKMIHRYVTIPAQACRRVDPNHLNLGMRYAYITDKSLLAGYENFDVFSINSYQMNPYQQIENVGKLLEKPVMIGEFHHGALDRGLTATGIRAVASQEERAVAYRYYVEQGAISSYFLGAHYFQLNDQSALGRFDGENYQIGMLDICQNAHMEISTEAAECHSGIYELLQGEKTAYARVPKEIPTIHY